MQLCIVFTRVDILLYLRDAGAALGLVVKVQFFHSDIIIIFFYQIFFL